MAFVPKVVWSIACLAPYPSIEKHIKSPACSPNAPYKHQPLPQLPHHEFLTHVYLPLTPTRSTPSFDMLSFIAVRFGNNGNNPLIVVAAFASSTVGFVASLLAIMLMYCAPSYRPNGPEFNAPVKSDNDDSRSNTRSRATSVSTVASTTSTLVGTTPVKAKEETAPKRRFSPNISKKIQDLPSKLIRKPSHINLPKLHNPLHMNSPIHLHTPKMFTKEHKWPLTPFAHWKMPTPGDSPSRSPGSYFPKFNGGGELQHHGRVLKNFVHRVKSGHFHAQTPAPSPLSSPLLEESSIHARPCFKGLARHFHLKSPLNTPVPLLKRTPTSYFSIIIEE